MDQSRMGRMREGRLSAHPQRPISTSYNHSSSLKESILVRWRLAPLRFLSRLRCGSQSCLLRGVAFVVQGEQAVEHRAPGGFGDGIADALLGLMETVSEVEAGPLVGGCNGVIHLNVQRAEGGDVVRDLVRGVEAVVSVGEALMTSGHDAAALRVVALADRFEGVQGRREGEGLERTLGEIGASGFVRHRAGPVRPNIMNRRRK